MISPLVYEALRKLSEMTDARDVFVARAVTMSNFDALTIVESLDMRAVLRGAMETNSISWELVKALFSKATTETIDIAGKPTLTEMTVHKDE